MSGPDELARGVLGALILKPGLLEAVEIKASDFPSGRFRETFTAISDQWEDGRPTSIDVFMLASKIPGVGPGEYVSSLTIGFAPKDLDPEAVTRRIFALRRQAARHRALALIDRALREEERMGEADPEQVAQVVAATAELNRLGTSSRAEINPADVLKRGEELQALDLKIEWTIEGLIPARAVTVFYGPGGIGKTWTMLQAAQAIVEGRNIFGRSVRKSSVIYVDFENPLSVIVDRTRKLGINNVQFWHSSFDPPPPRLDGENFDVYKRLPANSVICFDTLRAGHSGKENDSDVAAEIMCRMKELRDIGFNPVLLHHTPKRSDKESKGSTAITDLADHTLALYRVRRGTFEEIRDDDGEPGPDALFRFGTGTKTRFDPAEVFLKRSPAGGFIAAEDPDLPLMAGIQEYIRSCGIRPNQSQIKDWVKENLGINSSGKMNKLFNRGEGRLWQSRVEGKKNAKVYEAL